MISIIKVKDIYKLLTCQAKVIKENANKQEAVSTVLSGSPVSRSVYVVDDHRRLKGIITLEEIIKGVAVKSGIMPHDLNLNTPFQLLHYSPFGTARDLMAPPVSVTLETRLQEALEKMVEYRLNELPVVDDEGKIVGDLNAFEMLKFI